MRRIDISIKRELRLLRLRSELYLCCFTWIGVITYHVIFYPPFLLAHQPMHQDFQIVVQMTVQEIHFGTHWSKTAYRGLNEFFITWQVPISQETKSNLSKSIHFILKSKVSKICASCNSRLIYGPLNTPTLISLQDTATNLLLQYLILPFLSSSLRLFFKILHYPKLHIT